ncbi:TonB-dependent receptor [Zhongshania guokunii]|uniref:TonB-dependent receptor n=1 Tax=Zhongshania guokunii TaxID=641783 RepID=A0ABV3U3R3_9GAMM
MSNFKKVAPALALALTQASTMLHADESSLMIEEVLVTAQKRSSSLQDALMSVSAISGEDMSFRAQSSVEDLQSSVPGLNISNTGGAVLISMRGIGTNVFSGATEPGVALHIDGVYQPRPSIGPLGFSDLARVELLRGPQGTLYGRNSSGGVINFILNKPSEEFEASGLVRAANYETLGAVAKISGPISEHFRARLVLEGEQTDGYIKEQPGNRNSNESNGYGSRVALSYVSDGIFSADLSYLYRYDNGAGMSSNAVNRISPDPQRELTGFVFLPIATSQPDDAITDEPWQRKLNYHPDGERRTVNVSTKLNWSWDALDLSYTGGYQDHFRTEFFDADYTANDIYYIPGRHDSSESFGHELNISGDTEKLQWLAGLYYFEEEFSPYLPADVPQAGGGAGIFVRPKTVEDIEAIAVFSDITYAFTDQLELNLGVRALQDEKNAVQNIAFYTAGGAPIPSVPGTLESCENLELKTEASKVTPKVGLRYAFSDSFSVYGSRSVGYKSGGSNFTSCGDTYDPEEVVSAEIGIRSTWLNRRVIANMSIYDSQYKNFQTLKLNGLRGDIINAKAARITGGEIEAQFLLTQTLTLSSNISVMDAYYEDFADDDSSNPDAGEQDLSGVELTRAPDYTVNIAADYRWPLDLASFDEMRFRLEHFRSADVTLRPFDGPADVQEAYGFSNAFWALNGANLSLRLFIKNIESSEYYLFAAGDSTGRVHGSAGAPRQYGVELNYQL